MNYILHCIILFNVLLLGGTWMPGSIEIYREQAEGWNNKRMEFNNKAIEKSTTERYHLSVHWEVLPNPHMVLPVYSNNAGNTTQYITCWARLFKAGDGLWQKV